MEINENIRHQLITSMHDLKSRISDNDVIDFDYHVREEYDCEVLNLNLTIRVKK